MRHFQVDAHIYSKREVKRIARKTGKSRSEVVGAMVCLWGYVAVHSRDTGTIEGDYDDLADELDQDAEFWQVVQSEGWLTCDPEAMTITVPEWEARFYTGSNAERCKTYRENKAKTKSERVATQSQHVTDQSRQCHEHIEDKIIKDNKIKEKRREESNLSSDLLDLFLRNLADAGMQLPRKLPAWVPDALQGPDAQTYVNAAAELKHTNFMAQESPTHIGNFQTLEWVERLASGVLRKNGPVATAPKPEPADPLDRKVKNPYTALDCTLRELQEYKANPENANAIARIDRKYKRNLDRDAQRGDTPPADAPIPQAIPPVVLKNADEDFDTEAAKEKALAALAAHIEK